MAVQGFTLIEWLVVIAIIAILATLLLSVLSGAKAKGRCPVCRKKNLRQINLGVRMYADDANDTTPATHTANRIGGFYQNSAFGPFSVVAGHPKARNLGHSKFGGGL